MGVFVEAVVTQFVLHVEPDKDTAGHAGGKTRNVDDGLELVSKEITPCYDQVVSQHSGLPSE